MAIYRRSDFLDRGHSVHAFEHALAGVVVDQRRRLPPVGGKPSPQHFRSVIRADFLAACDHFSHPLLNPLEKDALVYLQFDHAIELQAPFGQQAIERFRLRHGSRKAIEHKAAVWRRTGRCDQR